MRVDSAGQAARLFSSPLFRPCLRHFTSIGEQMGTGRNSSLRCMCTCNISIQHTCYTHMHLVSVCRWCCAIDKRNDAISCLRRPPTRCVQAHNSFPRVVCLPTSPRYDAMHILTHQEAMGTFCIFPYGGIILWMPPTETKPHWKYGIRLNGRTSFDTREIGRGAGVETDLRSTIRSSLVCRDTATAPRLINLLSIVFSTRKREHVRCALSRRWDAPPRVCPHLPARRGNTSAVSSCKYKYQLTQLPVPIIPFKNFQT